MDRHEMEQALIQLSHAQGFYGRVLREMERLPDHIREEFWLNTEARNPRSIEDISALFDR